MANANGSSICMRLTRVLVLQAAKADLAKMASRESAAQEVLAAIRKGMDALRKGEDAWNMREAAQETRPRTLTSARRGWMSKWLIWTS